MMLKTNASGLENVINFQRGFGYLIGCSCLKIALRDIDGYERAVFAN